MSKSKNSKTKCLICYKQILEKLMVIIPCCKKQICQSCINEINKINKTSGCPYCREISLLFSLSYMSSSDSEEDDESYMMDPQLYEEYLDFLKHYEEKHNTVLEPEEEYDLRMEWYQNSSERQGNREWEEFTEEDDILNRRSRSP